MFVKHKISGIKQSRSYTDIKRCLGNNNEGFILQKYHKNNDSKAERRRFVIHVKIYLDKRAKLWYNKGIDGTNFRDKLGCPGNRRA